MASQASGDSAGGSATFSCSITTSRHVVLGGEGFAEYRIDLCRDGLKWHVWARFRQFEALQRALPGVEAARAPLPPKIFGLPRHSSSKEAVAARAPALERWLDGVLAEPAAFASLELLKFTGLITDETGMRRPPLHCSMLPRVAETGDCVLFRTKNPVATLQRAVTLSAWDHVGLLIHRNNAGLVCAAAEAATTGIIECDMNGCRYYSLDNYVACEWHRQYSEMALRQLLWDRRGAAEVSTALETWSDEVLGLPYRLTLAKITGGGGSGKGDGAGDAAGGDGGGDAAPPVSVPPNFFCSELVAHAYQTLGVLPASRPAAGYWPVTFSEDSGLELLRGASLGEAIPIDFRTPGVDRVRGAEPGGAAVRRAPPFAARMAAAGPARMAAVAAAAEAEGSSSDDVEPPRALDRALPVEPERDADG